MMQELLKKVKQNLILEHNEDNDLLMGYITAAISYAESYQHIPAGAYQIDPMPPTTEQAVIMLVTHFYESRDGSTGGFFLTMSRPDSRYGIPSICCSGSTGIGRCSVCQSA